MKKKTPKLPLRIGNIEVYPLGFGTRTWCTRLVSGPMGAINHASKKEAIDYANSQKK